MLSFFFPFRMEWMSFVATQWYRCCPQPMRRQRRHLFSSVSLLTRYKIAKINFNFWARAYIFRHSVLSLSKSNNFLGVFFFYLSLPLSFVCFVLSLFFSYFYFLGKFFVLHQLLTTKSAKNIACSEFCVLKLKGKERGWKDGREQGGRGEREETNRNKYTRSISTHFTNENTKMKIPAFCPCVWMFVALISAINKNTIRATESWARCGPNQNLYTYIFTKILAALRERLC